MKLEYYLYNRIYFPRCTYFGGAIFVMKEKIIIFSSAESLKIAQGIQRQLHYKRFDAKNWTNQFFKLSKSSITNFDNINKEYDFAVIVCSGDDITVKRNDEKPSIRDNVIFELGLCIGSFNLEKTIIVKDRNVTMPTDLEGIKTIVYEIEKDSDMNTTTGVICSHIEDYIDTYNAEHQNEIKKLPWETFSKQVAELVEKLRNSTRLGGFYFDAIVGISGGGLMVADLIAREYGQMTPVLSLMPDRREKDTTFVSDGLPIDNSKLIEILETKTIKSILVVDCMTREGNTIIEAKRFLQSKLPNKKIKSVVVYAEKDLKSSNIVSEIDYIGSFENLKNLKLKLK